MYNPLPIWVVWSHDAVQFPVKQYSGLFNIFGIVPVFEWAIWFSCSDGILRSRKFPIKANFLGKSMKIYSLCYVIKVWPYNFCVLLLCGCGQNTDVAYWYMKYRQFTCGAHWSCTYCPTQLSHEINLIRWKCCGHRCKELTSIVPSLLDKLNAHLQLCVGRV